MNNFSDFVNDLEVSTKKLQTGSITESEVNQFLLKTNKIYKNLGIKNNNLYAYIEDYGDGLNLGYVE